MDLVTENLQLKKILGITGEYMKSLFPDIQSTVQKAVRRSGFSLSWILSSLGVPTAWYYRHIEIGPILDRRFNSFSARDEEWIVTGFKHRNQRMSFREMAYTLIDEDLAYLPPSSVHRILKKHDLITPWRHPQWASTRPEHAKHPDQRWQTDIMYIKIMGRFFYT